MQERTGFGLIGHPLGHSFSAAYFREKFASERREGFFYHNIDTDDLEKEVSRLRSDTRYRGFNVTIPYKSLVIPFLNGLSPHAAAIGAVNTIRVEDDGRWIGYNTDCIGFFQSLQSLFNPGEKPQCALVLGNGGASSAIQYVLHRYRIPYVLVHRQSRPVGGCVFKPLSELSYAELDASIVAQCGLLVNTTSLGMSPHEETFPSIPYEAVNTHHKVFDVVYNPMETCFLRRCRAQGAQVKNGLEMLHLQAEAAWRIWQGDNTLSF